jgi:hypothetical protein
MLSSRGIRISLILCVAGASRSQVPDTSVGGALPLAVGNRWIYEEEIRQGNPRRPDVERWVQEETTVAVETLREGSLIRRKVRFLGKSAPPAWMRVPDESNILIRGACIYYLGAHHNGWGYGWDSARHELGEEFRQSLNSGDVLPDVCFPLHRGQTWGDPNKGRDLWTVTGIGPKNADDPVSTVAHPWRLEAHLTSGDDNYIWFKTGIGVTAERTFHNGTYDDLRIRLLRFEPASSGR